MLIHSVSIFIHLNIQDVVVIRGLSKTRLERLKIKIAPKVSSLRLPGSNRTPVQSSQTSSVKIK